MSCGCVTICSQNDGAAGIIKDSKNGFFWRNGIIKEIIESQNNDFILNNTFETIQNYTKEKACKNYLDKIMSD